MDFLDPNHHLRFSILVDRDRTKENDIERRAMFYLFSGVSELYDKVNHLYDFDRQWILPEVLEDESTVDLTSSMRTLVKLAYNLYNGYPSDTVLDTFSALDKNNRHVAIEAIAYRFHLGEQRS